MHWFFKRPDTTLDQADRTLGPFVHAAIRGLAAGELGTRPRIRRLAECYVYGAIRYLVSYDNMRPGSSDALLRNILVAHFDAGEPEVAECRRVFPGIREGQSEHRFMLEGASALRRWLVNGDRTVGTALRALLDDPRRS